MKNINSVADLKYAIKQLEDERVVKERLLKEQFYLTYEGFKPARLMQSTLKDMVSSPYLIDNIIDTGISLATGYLAKRVVVGASGSIIRKVLGSVLQTGVTSFVTKHPLRIKKIGQAIIQNVFHRNKMKSKKP